MIISIIEIVLAVLFIVYDIILLVLTPGTLFNVIFSFTHVWAIAGGILAFLGIYRIKNGKSWWFSIKKRLKILILIILSVGVIIAGINLGFILTPETVPLEYEGDYVILLGGGIDKDGKLPDTVLARVQKAADYMNAHENAVCVVSGGKLRWQNYAEGPELKNQLVAAGVDPDRVVVEEKALDTIQNFKYGLKKLSEKTGRSEQEILNGKVVVVTTNFHMRRSLRLARRMGYTDVVGVSSDIPWIKVPHSYLREIGSYIKLNMRILLTGEPSLI